MNRGLKILVPFLILAAGVGGAWLLFATAPAIEERPPAAVAPLVAVAALEPQTIRLTVHSQGTVAARTESELVPQVSGKVVEVAPAFVSGGYFEAGEVLLVIEPADYEVAVERARAGAARAESEAARARKELNRLRGLSASGVASQSQLDDVERAASVAVAGTREAAAVLEQAERDLERTRIRAPFAGRVREERVDLGQFVNRGAAVATIYATDRAEVRLPIADEELAFLELPLWHRGEPTLLGPEVTLRATFAGTRHEWVARVVRTEGEIDPRSRMVHVVAQVDDPYGRDGERPPLAVGLFVDAEILGREVRDVLVAPRSAMRDREHVLVVDSDDRLRLRRAEVVRHRNAEVILAAQSLQPGDRIVLTGLETAVDGMQVRPVVERDADAPAERL